MPSNHLILCHSLLLLPSIFPTIKVFSNESAVCIRWPKYWSFSISPSKNTQDWFLLELMGLISLQSKGLSRVLFSTTVQKCQFSGAQTSLWSNSHIHNWLLYGVCIQNYVTTVVRWAWNRMNVRVETADCVLCDCGKITESEEFQFGFEAVSLAWSQSINQVISRKSRFTGPFLH